MDPSKHTNSQRSPTKDCSWSSFSQVPARHRTLYHGTNTMLIEALLKNNLALNKIPLIEEARALVVGILNNEPNKLLLRYTSHSSLLRRTPILCCTPDRDSALHYAQSSPEVAYTLCAGCNEFCSLLDALWPNRFGAEIIKYKKLVEEIQELFRNAKPVVIKIEIPDLKLLGMTKSEQAKWLKNGSKLTELQSDSSSDHSSDTTFLGRTSGEFRVLSTLDIKYVVEQKQHSDLQLYIHDKSQIVKKVDPGYIHLSNLMREDREIRQSKISQQLEKMKLVAMSADVLCDEDVRLLGALVPELKSHLRQFENIGISILISKEWELNAQKFNAMLDTLEKFKRIFEDVVKAKPTLKEDINSTLEELLAYYRTVDLVLSENYYRASSKDNAEMRIGPWHVASGTGVEKLQRPALFISLEWSRQQSKQLRSIHSQTAIPEELPLNFEVLIAPAKPRSCLERWSDSLGPNNRVRN